MHDHNTVLAGGDTTIRAVDAVTADNAALDAAVHHSAFHAVHAVLLCTNLGKRVLPDQRCLCARALAQASRLRIVKHMRVDLIFCGHCPRQPFCAGSHPG